MPGLDFDEVLPPDDHRLLRTELARRLRESRTAGRRSSTLDKHAKERAGAGKRLQECRPDPADEASDWCAALCPRSLDILKRRQDQRKGGDAEAIHRRAGADVGQGIARAPGTLLGAQGELVAPTAMP